MQKIMIIEDEPAIREELALLLKNEGYCPIPVTDFSDVLSQAGQNRPDCILLDICLPERDGFLLCADLRKSVNVPIIFVTSRDSGMDEVRALVWGEMIILQNHIIFLSCWPGSRLFSAEAVKIWKLM